MSCPNCHGQTFEVIRDFVEYRCQGREPGCDVVITRPVEDDTVPVLGCAHCKQPRNVRSVYRRITHYCAKCGTWVP